MFLWGGRVAALPSTPPIRRNVPCAVLNFRPLRCSSTTACFFWITWLVSAQNIMFGKFTDGTRNGLYRSAQSSVVFRVFNFLYFFPLVLSAVE